MKAGFGDAGFNPVMHLTAKSWIGSVFYINNGSVM